MWKKASIRRYMSDNKKQTKVYHCGKHTCPIVNTVVKNKIEVSQLVKNNPNIKPAEIQSSCILAALRVGEDWRNVEKQAEATLDRKWISNLKQKLKKDIEPLGHDFEAVVTFKGYCDKKDDLYVYKINDSRGNPDMPSFVFKTSKQKALMALNMDRNGEHFLKDEYCYFDGKRKRCRGFVSLTSSLYHPLLRKQVPLATMEAASEDTENIQLFWKLFNEVLKKVSGKAEYKFNPVGFCTDMAGANFAAICNVFGSEAKLRIKSCEFHFKEQRNKKARRLDDESASQFKELCESMLISTTSQAYNSAKERMDNFIEEREDRGFLKSWISWWHERRGFIFRAFSPKDAPQMNQAEVIHAGWVHRDSPNLSLLDVCQADVRDSIILDVELKAYEGGSSSAGTGPSYSDLQRREHVRQVNRAKQMGRELFEEAESGLLIDPYSAHKPAQKRSRTATSKVPSKKKAVASAQRNSSDKTHEGAGSRNPDVNHLTNTHSFDFQQPFSSYPSSGIDFHQYSFTSPMHSFGGATPSSVHPPVLHTHQQTYRLPTMSPNPHHLPLPPSQQHQYQPYGLPQWFSGLSPHPYEIVILQSNVRKCYGCGCDFADKYRSPPYNLIVKHMDKRVISKNPDGQLMYSNDFSNTYYHPSSAHIKRKNPAFTGLVYINATFYNSLSQQQRQVLDGCEFNIHFK